MIKERLEELSTIDTVDVSFEIPTRDLMFPKDIDRASLDDETKIVDIDDSRISKIESQIQILNYPAPVRTKLKKLKMV